jgi:hypothetical protein
MEQKTLSEKQIESFYVYCGDDSQVDHFIKLVPRCLLGPENVVVDIGGGVGFFAESLRRRIEAEVRVLDTDPIAVETCLAKGVSAVIDNALSPTHRGDEDIVCFNLILHHIIASEDSATRLLQQQVLRSWLRYAKYIFVNEYSYESYVGNLTGRLIYLITKNKLLSGIGAIISYFIPSLKANTFGVGVRFRSGNDWVELFEESGFRVVKAVRGADKHVPFARRLLFLRSWRQDSYLLEPSR